MPFDRKKYQNALAQYKRGIQLAYGQGVPKDAAAAVAQYQLATAGGHSGAQNNLGFMLEHGLGIAENKAAALKQFRLAAAQGSRVALFNIGFMLAREQGIDKETVDKVAKIRLAAYEGDNEAKDFLRAMVWFRYWDNPQGDAAIIAQFQRAVADAQYERGNQLAYGEGVPKDAAAAVAQYQLAAAQGHSDAQNSLGFMLEHGLGIAENKAEALKQYRLAAAQGSEIALFNIGFMLAREQGIDKEIVDEVAKIRRAAYEGDVDAHTFLDTVQWSKHWNNPKEDTAIIAQFQRAVAEGLLETQYERGIQLAYGEGVPKDAAAAVAQFQLAAAAGHGEAQNTLGFMLEHGLGIAENKAKALKQYQLAAAGGHSGAQNSLGFMLEHGLGIAENKEEALKQFRLAAAQGSKAALFNIGFMLAREQGIDKETVDKVAKIRRAAYEGDSEAKDFLRAMVWSRYWDNPQGDAAIIAQFQSVVAYGLSDISDDPGIQLAYRQAQHNKNQTVDLSTHQKEFNLQLDTLQKIIDQLTIKQKNNSERYEVVLNTSINLHQILTKESKDFFENPIPGTFRTFHENSNKAIENAKEKFKNHRGIWYGQINPIIRKILGVLAALSVLPALMVATTSKHGFISTFFSTPKTDSLKQFEPIQEKIQEIDQQIEPKMK